MRTNTKSFILIFVVVSAIFVLAGIYFTEKKDLKIKYIIHSICNEKKDLFLSERQMINSESSLIKDLIFDKKINSLIYQYVNTKDLNVRKQIIKLVYPKYKVLKKYKITQLHLMFPDGTSIIRFNNLNKFGDKFLPMYLASKYLKSKKFFSSFVFTQDGLKYINLFPIYFDSRHIANVEIAFNYRNFLTHVFKRHYIAFLIDKKYAKEGKYSECNLNRDYVVDGRICRFFKNVNIKVNFDKKIIYVRDYVIFAYPIYFINKKLGYFIKVIPISSIKEVNDTVNNYIFTMFLLGVSYFVFVLLMFVFYKFKKVKITANIDMLTRVLNRRGCEEILSELKNYSLLLIDIDHFKNINDTYGHDVGDKILETLGEVLKKSVRAGDIVCRWGGEEFLVILPDTSIKEAVKIAEKIRKKVKENSFDNVKITVSIGIAVFEGDFEKAFKKADENLYKAKKSGRDRVVF